MKRLLLCLVALATMFSSARAQEVFRLGIIGLDTSHSVRFSELLNAKDSDDPFVRRFEVVAAYPYGTTTIESASSRIPKYIEEVQKYGVKVVGSIREVLDQVDGVFIETNDGRLHLEQAIEVFKSGKKVFIDKPMGATLGETIAIFKMAEKYGIPLLGQIPIVQSIRESGDSGEPAALSTRPDALAFIDLARSLAEAAG